MRIRSKNVNSRTGAVGFSLVEILVVIAILAILFGMAFKGGSSLITGGKTRHTEALLKNLEQAIEAYESEVNQSRIPYASSAFGKAPPDNPHVFDADSGADIGGNVVVMAKGKTAIHDDLEDLRGTSDGILSPALPSSLRHGDVRAMVLAMRLRSPKASVFLDRIDSQFRVSGGKEVDVVAEGWWFDPDSDDQNSQKISLDYYVDAWGTPIEYYSTREGPDKPDTAEGFRQQASAAFLKANNNQPLLVSYGPNGQEQLSAEFMADMGDTTIIGDYFDDTGGTAPDLKINQELNQDNIYSSDTFKQRMMK